MVQQVSQGGARQPKSVQPVQTKPIAKPVTKPASQSVVKKPVKQPVQTQQNPANSTNESVVQKSPWYKKWWIWVIFIGIVIAAVIGVWILFA